MKNLIIPTASIEEIRSFGAEFTKKQEIERTQNVVDFSPGQNYHWYQEIKKAQKFYKKIFGFTKFPDLSMPKHHSNINRVLFVFDNISEEDYRKAYAKEFGENQIFSSFVKGVEVVEQERPSGVYVFGYFDDPEVHLTKLSYNDAVLLNEPIMNTKEYIVSAFMRRYETGEIYDRKKSTILSSKVGGKARVMYSSKNSRMFPYYVDLNASSPLMGYRKIELVF